VNDRVELRQGSRADLPALEPLWVSVHQHHARVMPELAPYVDDRQTWSARSALYAQLLEKPDTVLFLAESSGGPVGYGLAHVLPAAQTWVGDTWWTGHRIGEIESLAVLPSHQGRGIGTRLFGVLIDALAADGVHDLVLGVLAGNAAAIRFYRRHGFRPTWNYLSRFTAR
jgi:ribosomal protein S18 acetylase RimI-like enzyme